MLQVAQAGARVTLTLKEFQRRQANGRRQRGRVLEMLLRQGCHPVALLGRDLASYQHTIRRSQQPIATGRTLQGVT